MEEVILHCKNCCASLLFCCKKTSYQTLIEKVRLDIQGRKKNFGVAYIDLKLKEGTTEEDLNACVQSAIDDIEALEKKIEGYNEDIENAKEEQQTTIQANIEQAEAAGSPTKTPVGSPTKEGEEAPAASKDEEAPAATKEEEAPAATKEEEAPTSSTA